MPLTGQVTYFAPLASNADNIPNRLALDGNELVIGAQADDFSGAQDIFTSVVHAFNVTTRTENWRADFSGSADAVDYIDVST